MMFTTSHCRLSLVVACEAAFRTPSGSWIRSAIMAKAKRPIPICLRIPTLGAHGKAAITAVQLETVWLRELAASDGTSRHALWGLARLYSETERRHDALACIETLARLTTRLDEMAWCHLAQGQLSEQLYDYESAVRHYRAGLALD